MTDIVKLKQEISKPQYQGLSDDEVLALLTDPTAVPIPAPKPAPTTYTLAESLGFGAKEISPADIKEARRLP